MNEGDVNDGPPAPAPPAPEATAPIAFLIPPSSLAAPAPPVAEAPPTLDVAGGQLVGWAALAIVNAVFIAITIRWPHGGTSIRALHHLYDASHLLAVGLLASTLADLYGRLGPRALRWSSLALAALAIGLGFVVLPVDLTGAVTTLTPGGNPDLWLAVFVVAFGVGIVISAWIGRKLARPWLRMVGVALGLAAAVANNLLLDNDYRGVHLYWAWGAATLLGASIAGVTVPSLLLRRSAGQRLSRLLRAKATRWISTAARAIVALLAARSIVLLPKNAVAIELFRVSGAVVAPLLARAALADLRPREANNGDVWLADARPDVPPSTPTLLAPDAIVILIVVDALRADVVAGGAHAEVLPVIESLRRESVDFTSARSPATGTIWTLASLFSSRYYSQLYWTTKPNGVTAKVYPHEDSSPRFPEVLRSGGISTVIYSEMPDVINEYGVARGFSEETVFRGRGHKGSIAITDAAIARVRASEGGPLFMYLHFLDAHEPYDRRGTKGTPFKRYLGEVQGVDEHIGRLVAALRDEKLAGRVTLILTGDHGEAFGEHGMRYHATSLYEELLRVPLLIRVPGVPPRQVDRPVSLIDLGATIVDLMGRTTPGSFMGQSLVPYLRGQDPVLQRPLIFDTGRWQQGVLFPDGIKAIRDRSRLTLELYDLASDPQELNALDCDDPFEPHLTYLRGFFGAQTLRRTGYEVPYRP